MSGSSRNRQIENQCNVEYNMWSDVAAMNRCPSRPTSLGFNSIGYWKLYRIFYWDFYTDMQENMWARLRDRGTLACEWFTQPSPHIFLHFCRRKKQATRHFWPIVTVDLLNTSLKKSYLILHKLFHSALHFRSWSRWTISHLAMMHFLSKPQWKEWSAAKCVRSGKPKSSKNSEVFQKLTITIEGVVIRKVEEVLHMCNFLEEVFLIWFSHPVVCETAYGSIVHEVHCWSHHAKLSPLWLLKFSTEKQRP